MKVRVYSDYVPVRVLRGVSGGSFTAPTNELADKMGLTGNFIEIDETKLPSDRTDRHLWRVVDGQVVIGTMTPEQAIALFNFKTLWGVVWSGGMSQGAMIELPPYQTTIESLWNFPNRSAIYPFMQGLVAAGKATSDDLTIIVNAFSAQGIDITTIS